MSREGWEPVEYEGWTFAGWIVRLPAGGTISASSEVVIALPDEWKPHARPVYERTATVAPRREWCPVCRRYHGNPGVKTDAGALVRPCLNLHRDDPRNQP